MYAVVDIETTGGSPDHEKITEIAIYLYDGEKITGQFSSLINPEKIIPYHITTLTGISNEMVANAPRFFEVAKEIVELTQDKIFVAHNVSFDYNFIKSEFKRLGYDFKRDKLCTVKLSRKLIPGKRSYSLGRLCEELGIQIEDRHRAGGDAQATVKLLDLLLKTDGARQGLIDEVRGISARNLHPSFALDSLKKIPEEAGVYYFLDEKNELIYIGKSRNLHQRVLSHFSGTTSRSAMKMRENIVSIDYSVTGNELIALLLESDEIKKHKPRFNRALRRANPQWGLFLRINDQGYHCLEIGKHSDTEDIPVCSFNNRQEGRDYLGNMVETFNLCQKLCGLYVSTGPCFHFEIRECRGACVGLELPELYNMRVTQALSRIKFQHQNFLILDKGRHDEEKSVVKIENGKYIGFGYISDDTIEGIESLHECIKPYPDNKDTHLIINQYLRHNKVIKILEF
jgi:DNA polymerase III subunit epsilon